VTAEDIQKAEEDEALGLGGPMGEMPPAEEPAPAEQVPVQ